jgi:hypothetical protein
MSNMLQRTLIGVTVVSLCLLILLLSTTTPATAGPIGLLVIFISAYLAAMGLMSFFLYGASRLLNFFLSGFTKKKRLYALSLKKSYYYGTVLAAAPVMLVGLQSVGSVGIYETVLVSLFVIIGCFYVSKRM